MGFGSRISRDLEYTERMPSEGLKTRGYKSDSHQSHINQKSMNRRNTKISDVLLALRDEIWDFEISFTILQSGPAAENVSGIFVSLQVRNIFFKRLHRLLNCDLCFHHHRSVNPTSCWVRWHVQNAFKAKTCKSGWLLVQLFSILFDSLATDQATSSLWHWWHLSWLLALQIIDALSGKLDCCIKFNNLKLILSQMYVLMRWSAPSAK